VITVLPPKQIVAEPLAVTVGKGVTVTVTAAVFEHPRDVPVTVYVLVTVGVATGVALVVLLNPVEGDQTYVVAPLAVNVVEVPLQIVISGLTVTFGTGLTVMVTVDVLLQGPVVPVTVYVVVADGEATGFATVELLNPAAGDQLYDVAPLAVRLVLNPSQIVVVPLMVTTGIGTIVTVTVAVAEHPPADPVTVYVVVEDGVATGFAIVVLLKPVAGNQLYVTAPPAVKFDELPAQILPPPVAVTEGAELIVMVTVPVPEHPLVFPVTV
jgi:hypothetical protein